MKTRPMLSRPIHVHLRPSHIGWSRSPWRARREPDQPLVIACFVEPSRPHRQHSVATARYLEVPVRHVKRRVTFEPKW